MKTKIDFTKLTHFDSPLEGERYLLYLGAETIIQDEIKKFKIGDLTFRIDSEYQCLYLYEELPELIATKLDNAGFERFFSHYHLITSLEMLTYIVAFVTNQKNPKQFLINNVKQMKIKTLLECQKFFDNYSASNSFFEQFDNATIPFLDDNFNPEEFIKNCSFQTTGVYEKEGVACLKFEWRRYDKPNILYSFTFHPYGASFTIMFDKPCHKNYEQIYHYLNQESETILYFPPENVPDRPIKLNVTSNSIKIGDQERTATAVDYDYFRKLQSQYCERKNNSDILKLNRKK